MYFADSESTRHHVLEESFRVSRNNQADAQRESAQNLLARGVKRRTHSDAQQPSLNIACPRKLATQHISVEPFTIKHSQHADSQSEVIGMPGAFSNDYKQTLPPRGSMQHWKSVLGPVQEAGSCSSAWPIKKGALARPSPHWRHVQEVDADVAVDVDCCGDSGSMSKLCSAAPPFCLKRPLRNSSVSATSHEGVKAQALVRRSAPVSTDIDMVSSQLCGLSHLSCYAPASSCTHAHALLQPALCTQDCQKQCRVDKSVACREM